MPKVALISLGCAKNLVDSEVMLGVLKRSGFTFVASPEAADVIVVNTCGFIQPARDEAEAALARAVRLKRRDPRKTVVAAGCYVARERAALEAKFPGIDAWTGVNAFDRIADVISGRDYLASDRTFLYTDTTPRLVTTPGTWAYVKISEGCSHRCGFCAIPLIKGPYVSRSMASVVREARELVGLGVREVNLISHDTTYYLRDRGTTGGLVKLLEKLLHIDGLAWIRLLYGYPEEVTDPLLGLLGDPKMCAYLDIPFQHADPGIIRAMRRGMEGERALRLLDRIRTRVPGVAVRTSLIVGFPGEGPREFGRLARFVERAALDHLGVFTYSPEQGTAACSLPDTVPATEKEKRRREIMEIQAAISLAKNRSAVGQVREVLLEGPAKRGRGFIGRTRSQAPEVDGQVRVGPSADASCGPQPIVNAKITGAGTYDLRARMVP